MIRKGKAMTEKETHLGQAADLRKLAKAIARERLYAELNHHSKPLAALYEIGSEITSELNIDALLLSIVKRACDLIGGTYCTCYLYKPEMDLLERGAYAGKTHHPGPQFRKCGEGLVGHIWSIQAPFLSNDYLSWPGRKKEHDSLPPRSMVGVPINFGDQFLGVLVVTAFLPHQFTEENTEVLGMFAIQAAIAIRNAQLYDQMNREIFERRKTEQEIALLAGIGRLISSTMNIDEIYEQFAAEAQKLISFDSISINLFNFQENTLRVAYVSGVDIDGRRPGDTIVLAGSLSEAVIRARTGLRVQPASFDEIEDQFPLLSPMFQAEMQSFVSVPLIYRNEVIGVLHFASKKQNAYTEQTFHLAERIGIQIAGAIGNAHLFNDLNKAEKAIRASLLEKETMLKEIHHRVKNNLQVISSLLGLQSSYLQDETARAAFNESISRVRTMAMIHTHLYQSADLARVDFGLFIRGLVDYIKQSYGRDHSSLEIGMDIIPTTLDIETAIPCGLILNELLANAMKHAFPEGRKGRIIIGMQLDGDNRVLTVCDNGNGFSEEIDSANVKSLGMKLVNILVEQIKGRIDRKIDNGVRWTITFPQKDERGWRNG